MTSSASVNVGPPPMAKFSLMAYVAVGATWKNVACVYRLPNPPGAPGVLDWGVKIGLVVLAG